MALHDRICRAWQQRHRRRGLTAAFAVAIFLALVPHPAGAATGLAIELVKPGREGLELSARLTDKGQPLQQNMSWNIRNPDGVSIFGGTEGTADVSIPPGDYVVNATYGATVVEELVSLPKGTRLRVNFVLDAGALRVEPLVTGIPVPAVASRVRVFSMDGKRLMAVSVMPNELIRLPEGTYRVESQVSTGNVKAVADVHVTAGRVATVKIAHKAGLARLAFVGAPNAVVRWQVEDQSGSPIATRGGINANVTLLPGTYTARAEVGAELLTATFNIAAGEVRDIMLGN